MTELGSFYRLYDRGGMDWDFSVEEGATLLAAWREWDLRGRLSPSLRTVTSIHGNELEIDLRSITQLFLVTPETRQSTRDRDKVFESENQAAGEWS
jgi:hypothetical protein